MWLVNVSLVDVIRGETAPGAALRIEKGVIADILTGPDAGSIDQMPGEAVLDLEGAYACPGLISCHTHLSLVFPFHEMDENEHPGHTALRSAVRAREALMGGVTTIRTTGELNRIDLVLRDAMDCGWVVGPNIVAAGRGIDVTGGHGEGFGVALADGADAFLKAARTELHAGADHIKIFLSGGIAGKAEGFGETKVSLEEAQAAVYAARSHQTYVTAHAGDVEPIKLGLKAGVRGYEHGYRLDGETAAAMAAADAWLIPTLVVSRSAEWMEAHRFAPWTIEKALAAAPRHMEGARAAVAAGVNIANGTDIPPGDAVDGTVAAVREAEHLVEAGLSAAKALRASTLGGAQLCEREGTLGTLDVGKQADMVAMSYNPLEDISALRGIFLVMRRGEIVRNDMRGSRPHG